jgi:hypothetical protein
MSLRAFLAALLWSLSIHKHAVVTHAISAIVPIVLLMRASPNLLSDRRQLDESQLCIHFLIPTLSARSKAMIFCGFDGSSATE